MPLCRYFKDIKNFELAKIYQYYFYAHIYKNFFLLLDLNQRFCLSYISYLLFIYKKYIIYIEKKTGKSYGSAGVSTYNSSSFSFLDYIKRVDNIILVINVYLKKKGKNVDITS